MGMPESLPLEVQKEILKGFCDFCRSLNAPVLGGHTIICPWPIMGGAVTAIAEIDEIVLISKAQLGDKVILTKPLGIQPVMRLLRLSDSQQKEIASIVSEDELSNAIDLAIRVMTTSNRDAAFAMLETGVNVATDITGFGLLGHASNMAEQSSVSIRINTLPVIRGAPQVANALGYPLLQGKASETAGGLLISLPKERVDQLLGALKERGVIGYVIGDVQKGQRKAFLDEDSEVLEVPS